MIEGLVSLGQYSSEDAIQRRFNDAKYLHSSSEHTTWEKMGCTPCIQMRIREAVYRYSISSRTCA